jgi:hypothetical protein
LAALESYAKERKVLNRHEAAAGESYATEGKGSNWQEAAAGEGKGLGWSQACSVSQQGGQNENTGNRDSKT